MKNVNNITRVTELFVMVLVLESWFMLGWIANHMG